MKNKIPSNRNFGIVFCCFFLILALFPFVFLQSKVNKIFATISAIFLFLVILNSKILIPFNKLWMKFGLLLNKITTYYYVNHLNIYFNSNWIFTKI